MIDPLDKVVHATEWALVLSDWRRSNADVTIHLRGGGTLGPGKVDRLPGPGLDAAQLNTWTTRDGRRHETKWTFDLNEVAAITAVAP